MTEVIVVGAGASATAAAFALAERGLRPLILDVGIRPRSVTSPVAADLYTHRRTSDTFDLTIGPDFRGLSNLMGESPMPVKLCTPNMEYVTRDADRWGPIEAIDFHPLQSFTAGGLANAWGAGLYRFCDRDLDGFPIRARDLTPHFDRLTDEIGIAGVEDDLAFSFGSGQGLLSPLPLSVNTGKLLRSYEARRDRLHRAGFHLGRARVAVLTHPLDGRPAHRFANLEFWQENRSLYSPRYTLDKLVAASGVEYRGNVLVQSWVETVDGVRVQALDVGSGETVFFEGRELILAAGAINSAKIVLQSRRDVRTGLPLLENPALIVPLVLPGSLGRRLDEGAFGLVQLNAVWESRFYDAVLQGSIMELTSPMRAEFFSGLPYSSRANLRLLRYLLPAMALMQLFFPGHSQDPARLSLKEDGRLRIQGHPNSIALQGMKGLLSLLRSLGAWSSPRLIVRVPTGHGIHYAGTLPMREAPGEYECYPSGRLQGTRHVSIADSASFPRLPAKNMSFGMMANAMRVAVGVAERLQESR